MDISITGSSSTAVFGYDASNQAIAPAAESTKEVQDSNAMLKSLMGYLDSIPSAQDQQTLILKERINQLVQLVKTEALSPEPKHQPSTAKTKKKALKRARSEPKGSKGSRPSSKQRKQ